MKLLLDSHNIMKINIFKCSPQLSLKRLEGLCVFLLTRHLRNRFAVKNSAQIKP